MADSGNIWFTLAIVYGDWSILKINQKVFFLSLSAMLYEQRLLSDESVILEISMLTIFLTEKWLCILFMSTNPYQQLVLTIDDV